MKTPGYRVCCGESGEYLGREKWGESAWGRQRGGEGRRGEEGRLRRISFEFLSNQYNQKNIKERAPMERNGQVCVDLNNSVTQSRVQLGSRCGGRDIHSYSPC